MKSKHSKIFLRLLCSVLIFILSASLLTGCQSRPLYAGKQATKSVGTVGEYDVPYEELYFLASSYKTEEMTSEELWELIGENIITSYAILTLCERYGLEIDSKELDEAVQSSIDDIIEEDFGGDRGDYIDALEQTCLTDHYVRFIMKTEILYGSLSTALASASEIETDEDAVVEYIEKNFVRTWHFMIADNEGDDASVNIANAQAALDALRAGETTMYKLIGSAQNEDLLITLDGYSFSRGSMEQAYEDAAFALEVGEYSEVITAKGELASGEYTDCHYVIQRLSLDSDYIKEHYSELYETYASSITAQKLDEVKRELVFTPNSYASSLDVTSLKEIGAGTDTFPIIITVICTVSAAVVALAVVLTVKHFKKKKQKLLEEAAARKALKGGK